METMTGILVLLLLTVQGISSIPAQTNNDGINDIRAAAFPCPIPEDIHPCVCWTEEEGIYLDCTDVTSEQQLENVFMQDFPVTEFYQFQINQTDILVDMNFTSNGVSFEKLLLYPGPLSIRSISNKFLMNSYTTLKTICIYNSQLTEAGFPLDNLNIFEMLDFLSFDGSNVSHLPNLVSETLTGLRIIYSDIVNLYPGKIICVVLRVIFHVCE
jgi:hypothetical protein